MKDGIRNVIDADLEGQERLQKKLEETEKALDEIQRDKLNIQSKVWEDAKAYLESEKSRLNNSLSDTEKLTENEFKASLKKFEDRFNANKEQWAQDIFNTCVGDVK